MIEALGLLAVGGLVVAFQSAQYYAGDLEKKTLAEKESCWIVQDPVQARLQYEVSRLALVPDTRVLQADGAFCWDSRCATWVAWA